MKYKKHKVVEVIFNRPVYLVFCLKFSCWGQNKTMTTKLKTNPPPLITILEPKFGTAMGWFYLVWYYTTMFLSIDDTNWFWRLRFELRVNLLNIRTAGFLEINYFLTKCNRVHRLCTMPVRPVTLFIILFATQTNIF